MVLGIPGCSPEALEAPRSNQNPAATEDAPAPTRESQPSPAAPGTEAGGTRSPRLVILPLKSFEIDRYEMVELQIETDIVAANPFNPEELDLRVAFTAPSGREVEIGAFWYREYRPPSAILASGPPSWRARFTPTETGSWTAEARLPARGLASEPLAFEVVPSENPGFVRVHPEDRRYLAFDDGSFFFPIGLNMAWWSGAGTAPGDYDAWMTPFVANGGNTIRVWMADWSFGLEGLDTELGDYTNRLGKAWLLDQIFQMAEDRGVYIILVLLNCADLNNWQTNGWNNNPYNAARGGPLDRPEDFATDPAARALLQRKLNYIVNRWGYSPNLLAWEWWNEVNLTPISDEALIPWLEEMTAYLRERDVNHHLTTNSYAIRYLSPIWNLPELDIIQRHEYGDQVDALDRDLAARAAADLRALRGSAPIKPVLLGEFGFSAANDIDRGETSGIHLHNGLWATTFVGYAGSGMYWYWDVYIAANRLWHHFNSLRQFLDGIDLTRYQPFSPLAIEGPEGSAPRADGLGLRGDDVLIWLRSDSYTVQSANQALAEAGAPRTFVYSPPLLEGRVVMIESMVDGDYRVTWYDPQRGTWREPIVHTARGGRLVVSVPGFRRDLAARIEPVR